MLPHGREGWVTKQVSDVTNRSDRVEASRPHPNEVGFGAGDAKGIPVVHAGPMSRRCIVFSIAVAIALVGDVQPAHGSTQSATGRPGLDQTLPSHVVARVGSRLVRRRVFDHWFRISAADGRRPRPGTRRYARLRRETMEFLIRATWVELEAKERRVHVSRKAVGRAFRMQKREAFRTERGYRRFLRSTEQTTNDVRYRIRLDLLQTRLVRRATARARTRAGYKRAVRVYARRFSRKWRARTICARGYGTRDCSREVPTAPQPQPAPPPTGGAGTALRARG